MPTTGQMGANAAGWIYEHDVTAAGEKTISLKTENKFVDSDINIKIITPAASAPTLDLTDKTTTIDMGTASSGVYSPAVDLSGNINITTGGWINSGNHTVTDTGVVIGKVNQSTIQNGSTPIASGATIIPSDSNQTITISEGYNAARTLIVGSADLSAAGSITSGSATIDSVAYSYNLTNNNFNITGSADVSAPTVNTPGYISAAKGDRNVNVGGATVTATVDKIILKSNLTGATTARKPIISKNAITISGVVDAASDEAQTTAPSSGVYVAVKSAANTATITASPSVKSAGYGDTSNYGKDSDATATVGAAASDVTYIPITTTTATIDGRTVSYGSGWITAGSSSINTGAVTSGAGTATISTPTYDSDASKFTQTASGAIAAPTVNTAGYISSSEGIRTGNSISGSKSLDVITVGTSVTGTTTLNSTISRTAKPSGDTWVDAASGSVVSTKPTAGAYVRVDNNSDSTTLAVIGTVTAEGYGTAEHYNASSNNTSVQVNGSTRYVPIKAGTITSGSGTISDIAVNYNSTSSNFQVTGSADISAPTFTEGYIASSVGTKNVNPGGAIVAASLNKIGITASISGTGTKQPTITKNVATNIPQAGTATTTAPSSGYYIAVSSAANTGTVNAIPTVSSAGYGTTTAGQYTATNSSDFTVGAAASATTYIPISQASFANTATSGVTYTDISSTAPALISGDFLYINAGYTTNQKISLAKLVPDAAGVNATADYILSGYTAYNNNGALITGNIQTYAGDYEII